MPKEYRTIQEVAGPLMLIRGVEGVTYNELGEIELQNGEKRRCKVLEVNGSNALVQLFENATGINLDNSKVRFLGRSMELGVSEDMLGRVFDGLGRPIDGKGPVDDVPHWPIHRKAPSFAEQKPATEILETGIKVIDLLAPYAKGGKIGLFGGAGFAGLFAVLACILTGAGQLVVIVGKALFGLVFVGFGFAGHIVHDGFAFADDFADGANQKEVQHVQCNEEVHQLENQGDIKVQHYRILPLDGVMFKAFIKYPQQGVMSKGIGDKIRKVFASAQTIL